MARCDYYSTVSELIRHEKKGQDYDIEIVENDRDRRVLVMAPHGGKIERHTDDLAEQIAGDEFVFYAFQGSKPRDNYDLLHVTSTNFDEPEAVRLAEQADVVLAVHGKSGEGEFAMVGGRHPELVGEVEALLQELGIETRDPPPRVAARSWDNICNRCQQGGVQLELSIALRERLATQPGLLDRFSGEIRARCRRAVGG